MKAATTRVRQCHHPVSSPSIFCILPWDCPRSVPQLLGKALFNIHSVKIGKDREGSLCLYRATKPYGEKNWIPAALSASATTWRAALAFPPPLAKGFIGSKPKLKLFTGQGVTDLQLAASQAQKKHRFQWELRSRLLCRRHVCYPALHTGHRQRSGEDTLICFMGLGIPWFFPS